MKAKPVVGRVMYDEVKKHFYLIWSVKESEMYRDRYHLNCHRVMPDGRVSKKPQRLMRGKVDLVPAELYVDIPD